MDIEKIYASYYIKVYSYLISISNDRELSEELAQETFFRVLNSKSEFRNDSNIYTYLCSIAKNLFLDEMRKKKRFAELDPDSNIASELNLEKDNEKKDLAFRAQLVLHNLEEPYKEVFQLRTFAELSFSDIGKVFGKTETWARVTYHRARIKIKERVDIDEV